MVNLNRVSMRMRRFIAVLFIAIFTITLTSCKGTTVDSVNFNDEYLKVGNHSVSNGELWNELKWNVADLFDDKATETVVDKQLTTIKETMADEKNENYDKYKKRIENYLIEKVYGFEFSLEDHQEEIDKLTKVDKETKEKTYAGNVVKQHNLDLKTENIVNAVKYLADSDNQELTSDKKATLVKLYELYYIDLAKELLAIEKLEQEIKEKDEEYKNDDDEDTIGYFSKSEIVTQYKDEYLNRGDVTAVVIEFASQAEADNTLKSFGIKSYQGKLYYMKDIIEKNADYSSYSLAYDKADMYDLVEDDKNPVIDLATQYDNDFFLQLYIAMYNYTYTYHKIDNRLKNIAYDNPTGSEFDNKVQAQKTVDQRKTTQIIMEECQIEEGSDLNTVKERIEKIQKNQTENGKKILNHSAEKMIEKSKSLYNYVYKDLDAASINKKNFTKTPESLDEKYYMVYKISYDKQENDKLYEKDMTDDELYDNIFKQDKLYNEIILDLKDKKITSSYISEKIDAELKDVKVKIFDKDIEIAYSVKHGDYNKTLSKGPDNNTLAEFTYGDIKKYFYLTTNDKTGAWDILEYRQGTNTALDIVTNMQIKSTQEYKDIPQRDIDAYYKTIEYILATFANDGFAQTGYPASIGKYNFLKLYYHDADIDEIVKNKFMVENVRAQLLSDYTDEDLLAFFKKYVDRSYDNYFSVTASQLKVTLDIDDDGKADEMSTWSNEQKSSAKELIALIYKRLSANGSSHAEALKTLVEEFNSTGRHLPGMDQGTNPVGNEWLYAKYRAQGFVLSIEEIKVDNTTLDKDIKVKNYLKDIYVKNNFQDGFIPNQLLPNPTEENIIEANDAMNYFVITAADKKPSAKFEEYKDIDGIYKDVYYLYNNDVVIIENLYNTDDKINLNQMKAFMYEYLESQSSDLIPSDISSALTSFFSPVLSRYQSEASQVILKLNYVASGDVNKLEFKDNKNKERFITLKKINEEQADNYANYEDEQYNNFAGWFDALNKISSKEAN